MRKSALKILSVFCLCALLCGCSRTTTETSNETGDTAAADAGLITDESQLESGQVYVLRDGFYYPTYVAAASFDTTDNSTTDSSRILWFSESEWEEIPTLYEGDVLIYHTDDTFDETFYFERFEYIGWGFGVCGLTETVTGRYSYAGDDTANMDETSSASALLLGEGVTAIIDVVGGVELRSANIDDGGFIIGLEKDATYEVEAYIGTNLNTLAITADRITLRSMDCDTTTDYSFLQSTTAEIYIPDEYNSGYYAVNGVGIFRYVKGDSWDEETDFNIINVTAEDEDAEADETDSDEETDEAEDEDAENTTESQETSADVSADETTSAAESDSDTENTTDTEAETPGSSTTAELIESLSNGEEYGSVDD